MIAVLPAHNEANGLAAAVAALGDQAMPPDRIIVVWDNCADGTVNVARRAGAEVWQTVGNTDKKAGALNQALNRLLPQLDDELILIQDADSVLGPELTRTAAYRIASEADAVGGVFHAKCPRSLLEHFQANESRNRRHTPTSTVSRATRSSIRPTSRSSLPNPPGNAPGQLLTLTRCHPMYLALQRYVVHARLVSTS